MRPKSLAQDSFEYFAGAALRQFSFREFDSPWHLVIGQSAPTMVDQFIGCKRFVRSQHHASHHDFAPMRIGYSKHSRLENVRMLVDARLDFAGIDVLATRNDHV